ncbi:methyltransferase domain-containing protein [Acidobacteria bacterium ACD]|nr:MAG: methyltransferase domain-containing protein [Acidobacteriota bacterium]MDL1950391.1 methyltransferase domain-containing protein [Acidobacteria bacterium ACD]
MTNARPRADRRGDAESIAREILQDLEALTTPLPGGPSSPGPAAPFAVGGGSGPGFSLDGPRRMLENGSRFVGPYLPGDARFRAAKALVLRALRIVTRDQTVFNSALVESLRIAYRELEEEVRRSRQQAREVAVEVREAEGRGERRVADAEARLVARVDARTLALENAIEREGTARTTLGAELLETERRVDRLEKADDVRGEALRSSEAARLDAERRLGERLEALSEELRRVRMEWTVLRAGIAPARAGEGAAAPAAGPAVARADDPLRAGLYTDFEETFRGSEEEIRRRQREDVTLFLGAPGPVADLGCGRGEFLEELSAGGAVAVGCDANPLMAARAREKGLAVDAADLFGWLAAREDGSLGGVTAYQVVEHLPPASLFDLVELAAAKLAPGGRILLETVNPESVYAMRWFWMDLSHVRPVPGPSLAQLLTACGFRDVAVSYRSPVPPGEAPPEEVFSDPRLGPLARLLYGPQDVVVTGVR